MSKYSFDVVSSICLNPKEHFSFKFLHKAQCLELKIDGYYISEPSIIQTVQLTALLEYLTPSVCSIRVVDQNSVYK